MKLSKKDILISIYFVFIMAIQIYLISHIFNEGIPTSVDLPDRLLKAKFTAGELIPNLKVDGWFPYYYGGFQLNQFYPPISYYLPGILYYISLTYISLIDAFKIVMVLIYITLPISVFLCCKLFYFDDFTAIISSFFALLISGMFSGPFGIFLQGEVPHALAFVIIPLAIGLAFRAFNENQKVYAIYAGIAISLVILSNPVAGIFTFLSVGVLFLFEFTPEFRFFKIRNFFIMLLIFFGLSTFWLIPMYMNLNDRGNATGWGIPNFHDKFNTLIDGKLIGDKLLVWSALLSIPIVVLRRRRYEIYFIIMSIISFILGLGVFYPLELGYPYAKDILLFFHVNEILFFFMHRGFSYIGIFAAILVGIGINSLFKYISAYYRLKFLLIPILFILILSSIYFYGIPYLQDIPNYMKVESDYSANIYVYDVSEWLKNNTNKNSITGIEEGPQTRYYEFGYVILDHVIPIYSDRNFLFGYYAEGTKSVSHAGILYKLRDAEIEYIQKDLKKYGVDYLITSTKEVYNRLENSKNFHLRFENEKLAIWEIEDPPDMTTLRRKDLIYFNRDATGFDYIINVTTTEIILPINYNKRWKAYVNGEEIPIKKAKSDLIELKLPYTGFLEIKLKYLPDYIDIASRIITLITILVIIYILVIRRYNSINVSRH